jgi:2-oxoglutarate dehydrogenase E1 component
MYKVQVVFNSLTPLAPRVCGARKFVSWLVRSDPLTRTSQVMVSEPLRRHNSRVATEPFLNGSSSSYVEEMYNAWLQDPHSVHIVRVYCHN